MVSKHSVHPDQTAPEKGQPDQSIPTAIMPVSTGHIALYRLFFFRPSIGFFLQTFYRLFFFRPGFDSRRLHILSCWEPEKRDLKPWIGMFQFDHTCNMLVLESTQHQVRVATRVNLESQLFSLKIYRLH